ncbi:MAG: hypothetical protein M1833_001975 [Piccolia ochrophora]|nr:MAG: hypothetical protein M1833_001975 [Piccolia ochrophora]
MRTACLSTPLLVLSAQALSVTHTLSSRLVTSVQCLTHKTNSPVATPIPTSTTTKRLLPSIAVIVEISSPVRTVTASAITVTSSVLTETTVTTTAPATTGTFSSTSILTATETSTVTSAVVSTVIVSTSTSTTSTSIIPAPSGFKPAYDTTGETTLAKHKRRELDQSPPRPRRLMLPVPRTINSARGLPTVDTPTTDPYWSTTRTNTRTSTMREARMTVVSTASMIGSGTTVKYQSSNPTGRTLELVRSLANLQVSTNRNCATTQAFQFNVSSTLSSLAYSPLSSFPMVLAG